MEEDLMQMPPTVVDLSWHRDEKGTFYAEGTKAFLVLWFAKTDDMFRMGFTCTTGNIDGRRTKKVRWTPSRARTGYVADLALFEEEYATEIGYAQAQDAVLIAAKRTVERHAAEQAHAAGLIERRKLVRELQDAASTYLACCPDLLTVRQHQLLTTIVDRDDLHDTDIGQIRRAIGAVNELLVRFG